MKVKMLCARTDGLKPGDIAEVPDDEGQRMIAARQAVPVDVVETASTAPPERATRRRTSKPRPPAKE